MKVKSFTVTRESRRILTMPDFELFPGKVLAVIGANGSGKSTLARALAGVISPDGGQSPLGREIRAAYMPQKSYAFRMSLNANILLANRDRARAAQLTEALGLDALSRRRADRLSGGETAKMALARVLMTDADLLLLDEPTAAMDVAASILAENLIRSRESAVLLVTHSLQQARRVADEAMFLREGELWESGPAERLLYNPRRTETKEFLNFYS